ncbi:S8 family serine peptidase, partial [Candidatus Woesearchaeota archaeon]|nr:S8 family serine peptidase [Candidatus Woesearchaeota archaeon]
VASFLNGSCSKVPGGYDYYNNDTDPMDDNGHGTHVAGIVASANSTYKGVAPGARIVAMKACDNTGNACTTAAIASSIDWCVSNRALYNISVISMSLGTDTLYTNYCDDSYVTFKTSIEAAIAANISVLAASGNGNPGSSTGIASPACIKNTTAVASSTKSDGVSSFSDRNNITDLIAPGSSITSLEWSPSSCLSGCSCSSGVMTCSGTSMATPHAAGAFALLRQFRRVLSNVTLSPDQVQSALQSSGVQINDTAGNKLFYRRISLYSALLYLDNVSANISFISPTPSNSSLVSGSRFIVNISVNVSGNGSLSAATLEWNLTANYTMTASNYTAYFINLGGLRNGNSTFRVFMNNSLVNVGTSNNMLVQVNNSPPNITSFSPSSLNFSISEPANQSFNLSYNDMNNDPVIITWYKNGSNQSAFFNLTSFNFTGNYSSAGSYNITAVVDDGSLVNFTTWTLTVNNTDRAPLWNFTPQNQSVLVASNLSFNVTAYDPDGNNITYFINDSRFSINSSNGSISLVSPFNSSVTVFLNVSASDGALNLSGIIFVNVSDVLSFIAPTPLNNSVVSGSHLTVNISSGKSLSSAFLEWNLTANYTMYSLNSTVFYLILGNISNGNSSFRVFGNDTSGTFWASTKISILVNNSPPNISSFSPSSLNFTISEGVNQSFSISFNDSNNDQVTITWLLNGANQSAFFNLASFNYTPNSPNAGSYNVTALLSDGSLYNFTFWNMTVRNSGVKVQSDSLSYQCYPGCIIFFNVTNYESNYSQLLNITVKLNDSSSLSSYNISYLNLSNLSQWVSASSNNQTNLTNYNFSLFNASFPNSTVHQFMISVNMSQPVGDMVVFNITLANSSGFNISYFAIAWLDTINLTNPEDNNITAVQNPSISFSLFSLNTTSQACALRINGSLYVNSSVANATLAAFIVNQTLANGSYSYNVSCTNSNTGVTGSSAVRVIRINDIIKPSFNQTPGAVAGSSSAALNWTTDERANTTIAYGTSSGSLPSAAVETGFNTGHRVSISGLSSSTRYYFNVTACDNVGNCNTSGVFNFTTSAGSSTSSDSGSSSGSGGGGGGGSTQPAGNVKSEYSKAWDAIQGGVSTTVEVNKPEISISSIVFSLDSPAVGADLSVSSLNGLPSAVPSNTGASVYQYIQVTHKNIADSQLSSVTISFAVPLAWLSGKGLDTNDVAIYRLDEGSRLWNPLPTRYARSDAASAYYSAVSPGLSYYSVGAIIPRQEGTPNQNISLTNLTQELKDKANTSLFNQSVLNHAVNESKTESEVNPPKPGNQKESDLSLFSLAKPAYVLIALILVAALIISFILFRRMKRGFYQERKL